jgi:hypothetical protein
MGLRIAEITMSDKQSSSSLSRRRVFAAGGTVGALAAAAAVVPLAKAPAPTDAGAAKPAPDKGGGYRLTAHVQHYYDTTRI